MRCSLEFLRLRQLGGPRIAHEELVLEMRLRAAGGGPAPLRVLERPLEPKTHTGAVRSTSRTQAGEVSQPARVGRASSETHDHADMSSGTWPCGVAAVVGWGPEPWATAAEGLPSTWGQAPLRQLGASETARAWCGHGVEVGEERVNGVRRSCKCRRCLCCSFHFFQHRCSCSRAAAGDGVAAGSGPLDGDASGGGDGAAADAENRAAYGAVDAQGEASWGA